MSSQSKSFNRFRDGMWTCKLIIIDRQQGQHHPISFPDPGFPPLDEIVQTIKNKYQLDILSSDKRSWSTVVDLPQGGSIVKYFKTFAELVCTIRDSSSRQQHTQFGLTVEHVQAPQEASSAAAPIEEQIAQDLQKVDIDDQVRNVDLSGETRDNEVKRKGYVRVAYDDAFEWNVARRDGKWKVVVVLLDGTMFSWEDDEWPVHTRGSIQSSLRIKYKIAVDKDLATRFFVRVTRNGIEEYAFSDDDNTFHFMSKLFESTRGFKVEDPPTLYCKFYEPDQDYASDDPFEPEISFKTSHLVFRRAKTTLVSKVSSDKDTARTSETQVSAARCEGSDFEAGQILLREGRKENPEASGIAAVSSEEENTEAIKNSAHETLPQTSGSPALDARKDKDNDASHASKESVTEPVAITYSARNVAINRDETFYPLGNGKDSQPISSLTANEYLNDQIEKGVNTPASTRLLLILKDEGVELDSKLGLKLLELARKLQENGALMASQRDDKSRITKLKAKSKSQRGELNTLRQQVSDLRCELEEVNPVIQSPDNRLLPVLQSRVTGKLDEAVTHESIAILPKNSTGGGQDHKSASQTLKEVFEQAKTLASETELPAGFVSSQSVESDGTTESSPEASRAESESINSFIHIAPLNARLSDSAQNTPWAQNTTWVHECPSSKEARNGARQLPIPSIAGHGSGDDYSEYEGGMKNRATLPRDGNEAVARSSSKGSFYTFTRPSGTSIKMYNALPGTEKAIPKSTTPSHQLERQIEPIDHHDSCRCLRCSVKINPRLTGFGSRPLPIWARDIPCKCVECYRADRQALYEQQAALVQQNRSSIHPDRFQGGAGYYGYPVPYGY